MEQGPTSKIVDALRHVAPGTQLRDGLDRVLQSGRGGLIVIGDSPEVLSICSGGFLMDAAFTPQRLSELAKMDGAIILDADASRIARANVHLVPNPNVQTNETGTRHRTAERVAKALGVTVIAVSESRKEIQLYRGSERYPLPPVGRLLDRSNQALQTLERYRSRLWTVSKNLTALEVEDLVTPRDVIEMLQRTEMVVRIADEVRRNLVELGSDGRLVRLLLEELMSGVDDDRRMLIKDYFHEDATFHVEEAMEALTALDDDELFDEAQIARAVHLGHGDADLNESLQARGYRLLSKLPRTSPAAIDAIVSRFESIQAILRATASDLESIEELDQAEVPAIKSGLARLAESSILERYGRE